MYLVTEALNQIKSFLNNMALCMKPCKFEKKKKKTYWVTMSYNSELQRERRGVYASFCTALSCLQRRYFFSHSLDM